MLLLRGYISGAATPESTSKTEKREGRDQNRTGMANLAGDAPNLSVTRPHAFILGPFPLYCKTNIPKFVLRTARSWFKTGSKYKRPPCFWVAHCASKSLVLLLVRMGRVELPSIGVKICRAGHKILATQSTPPTLRGARSGRWRGILTPMELPRVTPLEPESDLGGRERPGAANFNILR